jgi:hypothetical protein
MIPFLEYIRQVHWRDSCEMSLLSAYGDWRIDGRYK